MNPKNIRYSVLTLFLLIVGRSVCETNSPYANLDTDKLEKEKLSRKIISQQMQNDMFYGTDDYFGQNRDLSYCDSVVPTFRKPVIVVEKPKEEQKEEDNTQKDTTVNTVVSSSPSSSSPSPSSEPVANPVVTPTTPPTPSDPVVIPPPEVPPPEAPPACPT